MWEGQHVGRRLGPLRRAARREPQPDAPGGFYTPEERLYQLKWQDAPLTARVRSGHGSCTRSSVVRPSGRLLSEQRRVHGGRLPRRRQGPGEERRLQRRTPRHLSLLQMAHAGDHLPTSESATFSSCGTRLRRRLGDRFSLRDFHERFLSAGTIPRGLRPRHASSGTPRDPETRSRDATTK